MANTAQFSLPLVAPSQAQKHVTVNESLAILDAVSQLRVKDDGLQTPPGTAVDGDAYIVPVGATDHWAGEVGKIAIYSNGGWIFISPRTGWRTWNIAAGNEFVFTGGRWISGCLAVGSSGAATRSLIVEIDHSIESGALSTLGNAIPANTVVIGVSGIVTSEILGTASGWSLGVTGSTDRYGSGLGLAQTSFARGLTSSPLAYYSDTDLIVTAEGGDFTSGSIRVAVHLLTIDGPDVI